MSSVIDPKEIAILTTEVRHLTDAVKKLIGDMEGHRVELQTKADLSDVQDMKETVLLLQEREQVGRERDEATITRVTALESKMIKLEMETWKLGLLVSGSATGGGVLALVGQYVVGLILA